MKHLIKFKFLEDYAEEFLDNGTSVLPNVSYVENETIRNKVKFYAKPYRTAKFIPYDTQPYVLLFKDWRNLGNVWVDGVKLDELKEYKFTVTKDDVTYTEDGWYELNSQKTQNLPHVRSYEILLENEQIKDDDELYILINAAYGSAMLEHIGTINDCIMQGIVSYGAKKQSLLVNAAIFEYGFFGGVGGFILRNGEIVNTVNKLIHGTEDELDGIRITNDNWMDIQMPNVSSVDTVRLVVDNIDDINDKTYVIGIDGGEYFKLASLVDVGSYYMNGQLTLPLGGGSFDGLLAFAELDENENVVKVLDSTFYFSIGYEDDVPYDSVTVVNSGQSEVNVTFETLNRFVTPQFEDGELSELGKDALKYVTSIGFNAFYNCRSLTSIEIPSSVTTINDYAFYNCSSLTHAEIGDGVTFICDSAFKDCTSLTSVVIPSSVTYIGYDAFSNTPFHNNLPNGEIYLGSCYYKYKGTMPSNTSITIKDGTKSICYAAFSYCTSLSSITIPDSVTSISNYAFNNCTSLTSVIIPNSVITIGSNAFDNCTSLTSVIIPNSVITIGSNAFYNCYFEHDKFINNSSATGYPWGANLCDVVQEDGLCISGTTAVKCKQNATSVIIPDSVTTINDYAFLNCTSLSSVTIGNGVTSINYGAFDNCPSLSSVTIGNSVTYIGYYAFEGCSGLTSIVIPSSVTSIGVRAFQNCTSLSSITCHATTRPTLGSYALDNLSTNGKLYVPSGSDYSSWLGKLGSGWSIEYI